MSKRGSTLAGVMDAFSVSISNGLQYGVPLEAFLSKYINMRFDPAGMTDDADIRIAQLVMDYPSHGAGLPAAGEARRARHLVGRGARCCGRNRLVRVQC
jgi:ribonucleoside-diphosphate reductase alpha chain